MPPKKGMKPLVNKIKQAEVRKKMSDPSMNGPHSRTMTRVSGYDKYAPDAEDEIMVEGQTYNDVIFVEAAPADRRIGIDKHGVIRVPWSTVIYLAHKDIPFVWNSEKHYHHLIKITGKKTFVSHNVDKNLFT